MTDQPTTRKGRRRLTEQARLIRLWWVLNVVVVAAAILFAARTLIT